MDCSSPGIPVLHHLLELAQTHVYWVSDAIQPSHLCHSLLLLPSIFRTLRVSSNELALHIRWPKYWSFSISPSNEYQGWFPLGLTGLISLLSKGLLKVFSTTAIWKHQFFSAQPSLWSNSHFHILLLGKPLLWLYGLLLTMWWLFFNMLSRFVIAFLPRKTVF